MIEWNMPPWRFSRAGSPNFYMSYARPTIFVSSLTTNLDDDLLKIEAASVGAQLDFAFTIKSRYKMTLSFGYALGYLDSTKTDEEFMVSLKIL
jgi:hypothetical protein